MSLLLCDSGEDHGVKTMACEKCGISFRLSRSWRRFCTDRCARNAQADRHRERYPRERRPVLAAFVPFTCSRCGVETRPPRRGRAPSYPYCSPCRARALAKERQRAWETRYPDRAAASRRASNLKKRLRPEMRFHMSVSSQIRNALREGKAGRKWEHLVGYTLAELMLHIERQFLPGMTWGNHGSWHLDHILPKAMFRYACAEDEAFRACWALTNLRPLWKADNLSKRDKRTLLV